MGHDDLDSAERRWRSRSLFRRDRRRSHGLTALLLLLLAAACLWAALNPAFIPSATTLLQLLPPVQ